jgi:DNA-binding IclR family transcriptional regulator
VQARERLAKILEVVVSRELVSPGDVVVETGLPRYLVLAAFQCLEALGLVEPVFSKGSYKLYSPRPLARKLLEALHAGVQEPLLAIFEPPTAQREAEPAEATAG